MVCDDSVKAIQLMNFQSKLEMIIIIDEITQEARDKASESNIKIFSLNEIIEVGKQELKEPVVSIKRFYIIHPNSLLKIKIFSATKTR